MDFMDSIDFRECDRIVSSLKKKKKDCGSRLDTLVLMSMQLRHELSSEDVDFNKDIFGSRDEYLRCQKNRFAEKVLSLIFGNS